MSMASGVPVVFPPNTPESICAVSLSLRCVVIFDWPGRRLSNSDWMNDSSMVILAGQPSIITPMAFPCDSPKVVLRNTSPNEFSALLFLTFGIRCQIPDFPNLKVGLRYNKSLLFQMFPEIGIGFFHD